MPSPPIATLFLLLSVIIGHVASFDWSEVADKLHFYHQQGAYPGSLLLVSNHTHTLYQHAVGTLTKVSPPFYSPPMGLDTIFDVASLTKVTATLTCIMHLYDREIIDINDPVLKYVPEYNSGGKQTTTIKNLLLHNAGLPEDYPPPFPDQKQIVMDWIYAYQLQYPVGTKYLYSDLGFIILAEIAERVMGGPLDDYSQILLRQIGLTNRTVFTPKINLPLLLHLIAPTEYSRNHLI